MYAPRPAKINESTWEFLLRSLRASLQEDRPALFTRLGYPSLPKYIASDCLDVIVQNPLPFLLEVGFLDHPKLLAQSIYTDNDGTNYLILPFDDPQHIQVQRIYDKKTSEVALAELANLLKNSPDFDQLEGTEPERHNPKNLQKILDHFEAGHLLHYEPHWPYCELTTTHAGYILYETESGYGRKEAANAQEHITLAFGKPEICTYGTAHHTSLHRFHHNYLLFRLQ